jgi:hypothetical protein
LTPALENRCAKTSVPLTPPALVSPVTTKFPAASHATAGLTA